MRGKMTMRTSILRNLPAADDPWGGAGDPDWQTQTTDLPCYGYAAGGSTGAERTVVSEDRTVVVEDRRVGFPLGTDIRPGDRLGDVVDRRGAVKFAGPMDVDAVVARPTHLEASVEQTTATSVGG